MGFRLRPAFVFSNKKVTLKYLNAKSLTEFKSLSSHNLLSYNNSLVNITIKANLHKKGINLSKSKPTDSYEAYAARTDVLV
jgi:hypothetical protein